MREKRKRGNERTRRERKRMRVKRERKRERMLTSGGGEIYRGTDR